MSAEAVTLAIDASTYTGTVAVLRGARVLADGAVAMRGEKEERLMPAVAAALASAGITVDAVDRVVCGGGPGSFTSLRIAASIAKGIATVRGIPLLVVPSLALVVAGQESALEPGRYLAVLDAMRGDVHAALVAVDGAGQAALESEAMLLAAGDVAAVAEREGATPTGPAQARTAWPHARGVSRLERSLLLVSLQEWEPTYGRLAEAQVKWEAAHGRALPRA